jgi:hypothetical protein
MSLPRSLPPTAPDPALMELFTRPDGVPKAVRSQAAFFLFLARTVLPLLEHYRERLATVYTPENGRPAWDPVRLLGVLVLQFVLRVPDRQAAELVQYDPRWRLALHLATGEAAFDPSLLTVFRNRLVEGEQAGRDMLAIWQAAAGCEDIVARDAFILLLRVFLENYTIEASGEIAKTRAQPTGAVHNPHEPEAQWSSKAKPSRTRATKAASCAGPPRPRRTAARCSRWRPSMC